MKKNLNRKVLVCEDDRHIAEIIEIILRSRGYEVKTLAHGREIQKEVVAFLPDIILLDLWMPDIDGIKIASLLKKNTVSGSIPIIVISALSDARQISKEIDADDFLAKPFEMNDLISIVARHA